MHEKLKDIFFFKFKTWTKLVLTSTLKNEKFIKFQNCKSDNEFL